MDDSSISPPVSPTRMYHSAHQADESSSTVDIASFVSMIKSNSENIKLEAASTLLHVLLMNHVNTVVMCGAVPVLLVALESPNQSVRDECVKCLSVIISSSPIHRNCVIQGGGLSALLQCIDNATGDISLNIVLEALSIFCNHKDRPSCASLDPFLSQIICMLDARQDSNVIIQCSKVITYLADGSPQIVKALLRHGAKKCLMQLLSHSEESVVVSALRASRYLVPPKVSHPACNVPISPIQSIKPSLGSAEKEWTLSPLMSAALVAQYSEMPEIDSVVCQNVELFKASEQDISSMAMMLGVSIVAGQVGIRCRHCCKTPFASDKIVFPASINSMATNIRHIACSHFSSCSRISPHTKAKIAELTSTGCAVKSVDKPEAYYAHICNMNGVNDLSAQRTGIILSGAKVSCNTAQKPRMLRFETPSSTSFSTSTATQYYSIIQPPSNTSSLYTPIIKIPESTTSGALAVPTQAFCLGSKDMEQGGFMPVSKGIWKCMQCIGSNIKLSSSVWKGDCSPPVVYVKTHLRECPNSNHSDLEDHDDGALSPKQYPSDSKGGQNGMVDNVFTFKCSDTPDVHDILENTSLVKEEDKALLTDYVALFMDQFKICYYKESVNGGKAALPEGFPGLVCKHCSGDKKARYFFWSSLDRFKNNNSNFPAHLLKCKNCPDAMKHQLTTTKSYHYHQMKHLKRGSITTFFRRIYGRLQVPEKPSSTPIFSEKAPIEIQRKPSGNDLPLDIPPTKNSSEDKVQSNSISVPDDFDWLSETECYLRKNLEFFCTTDSDVKFFGNCPDAELPREGQIGARCIHCAQQMRCKGLSDPRVFRLFSSVKNIRATILDFQEHLSHCQHASSHCNEVFKSPRLTTHTARIVAEYYERCHFNLGLIDDKGLVRSLPQGQIITVNSNNSESTHDSNSCETVHAVKTGDMDTCINESPQLPSVTPLERGRKRDFVII